MKIIEKNGGRFSSNLTQKTDVLIYGENTSSKMDKAKKFNIKMIEFNEFIKDIIKMELFDKSISKKHIDYSEITSNCQKVAKLLNRSEIAKSNNLIVIVVMNGGFSFLQNYLNSLIIIFFLIMFKLHVIKIHPRW